MEYLFARIFKRNRGEFKEFDLRLRFDTHISNMVGYT